MYINSAWEKIGTTDVDLSGYLQSSDIAAWVKAANKPTYTASEVGALPSSTTYVSSFNGNSGAITYTAPVTSVNGKTGVVTIADENVKQSSVSESNSSSLPVLFSTANGNGEITTSTYKHNSFVYQPSTGRLTVKNIQVGSVAQPGKISLGSIAFTAPTDTTTNTITLPNASGTVALTSDIPSISAWAKAANKPTYTASEVGALPSSTTYVSSFNGQSGAITYTAPEQNVEVIELTFYNTIQENDETVWIYTTTQTTSEIKTKIDNGKVIVLKTDAAFYYFQGYDRGDTDLRFYGGMENLSCIYPYKMNNQYTYYWRSYTSNYGAVISNTLSSGTLIATIDGVDIYAPSYTDTDGVSY